MKILLLQAAEKDLLEYPDCLQICIRCIWDIKKIC